MRTAFFILLFCFSFSANAATFEFNSRLQQAYQAVIRLRFDEGRKLLEQEQRTNPSNALTGLYFSYIDFLKAFISEEEKDFKAFQGKMEKRLEALENGNSPFSLYAQSELMLQEAMLKVKFGEFISAAWQIRKSYKTIEKNKEKYPSFLLNRKVSGFLHVLIGAIPKNYRWLVDLAGMKGTIPQGTEELYGVLKESEGTGYAVYKEETLFYLSSIRYSLSKKENQSAELRDLMKPYCIQNPLLRYSYANLAVKAGKNDEAIKVLNDTSSSPGAFPFYFLNYKSGLAKLNRLDLSAEKDFAIFVANFHGINYLKSAHQKLAWIALMRGDLNKYRTHLSHCISSGSDMVDEDKEALKEATTGEIPNVLLLRARLYFDGGYFKEALKEIAGKGVENFPRQRDKLEVTYRTARIFHKLNQLDKAIDFYERTLRNGAASQTQFAANSALLLGNIYEEKNDVTKAKYYYNECLSLRDHEYQNSIDQKAAAGLERLNVKN